jgi:hypothetical protein
VNDMVVGEEDPRRHAGADVATLPQKIWHLPRGVSKAEREARLLDPVAIRDRQKN